MGAGGQSLHLSFGSSATFKLGVVVVAWVGWPACLWTLVAELLHVVTPFFGENRGLRVRSLSVSYSRR